MENFFFEDKRTCLCMRETRLAACAVTIYVCNARLPAYMRYMTVLHQWAEITHTQTPSGENFFLQINETAKAKGSYIIIKYSVSDCVISMFLTIIGSNSITFLFLGISM